MSILIKNVEFKKVRQDILIDGNKIAAIGEGLSFPAEKVIDGSGKAAVPGMVNGHTHAAMTLMRGYADDMPLMPWLQEKIWPLESKLNEEDVYWGTKLACLEMIKTGTTLMVDMYHHFSGMARAVDEMGIRGMLTFAGFDFNNPELTGLYKSNIEKYLKEMSSFSDRIQFAMGPHAIYTVSTPLMKWIKDFASANGLRITTHLSETIDEVNNSIAAFGMRPVNYLNSIGFLGSNVSLAHCIHIDDEELKILADNGCQAVHNPVSNLKLVSGNRFRYADLKNAGVTVCLGTDGACSGNNLDMYEAMKLASLSGKLAWDDPTIWNADETFAAATEVAEKLTGIKTGIIREGYLADICLVDLNRPEMIPNFHLISNLVYSANGSVVDTVICDGKVLMENRHVQGEEEIIRKAYEVAHDLVNR